MVLGSNLGHARRAVEYTSSKMSIGASNKLEDVISTVGFSIVCSLYVQNTDITDLDELIKLPKISLPIHIVTRAAHAESLGCGNCGEQAAIAFVHLFNVQKVKQLDLMHRTNADHAFVVIGRKSDSKLEDYNTWGDEAVICDPWDNKSYSCSDIAKNMPGGGVFSPALDHRVG
jgi:hypothetical protein